MSNDDQTTIHVSLRNKLLTREEKLRAEGLAACTHQLDSVRRQVGIVYGQWLAGIVGKYGWPGKDLVGADGAKAACTIAEHAGGAELSGWTLLIRRKMAKGQVPPLHVARVWDAAFMARRERQLCGTQSLVIGDKCKLWPIIVSAQNCNEQRALLGAGALPPDAESWDHIPREWE